MIRVLIIGLGSIGQRHALALNSIGVSNVAALRTNKGQKELDERLNFIQMFFDENKAFKWKPTHLIISNPTSEHMYFVDLAIKNGLKFFVEKPISDKLQDISPSFLKDSLKGSVGYNLRFHSFFKSIKDFIISEVFGKVITAKLHVGQYLPNWHPYEDYRNAYYSKKELGGGGLRTLSHEIDLLQYFFGDIKSVFAKVEKNSDLETDVDDVVNIIASSKQCSQINLHINLLDPEVKRKGLIYFNEGVLEYDFIKSEIIFEANNKERKTLYSVQEDFNQQYENQMKEFVGIDTSNYACSFIQGYNVMRIIDICEESQKTKIELCLD